MATSTIAVDYSFWPCVSDSEFIIHKVIFSRLSTHLALIMNLQRRFVENPALGATFLNSSLAAASLLDSRLQLNIVPPTQLVSLSSPVELCVSQKQRFN